MFMISMVCIQKSLPPNNSTGSVSHQCTFRKLISTEMIWIANRYPLLITWDLYIYILYYWKFYISNRIYQDLLVCLFVLGFHTLRCRSPDNRNYQNLKQCHWYWYIWKLKALNFWKQYIDIRVTLGKKPIHR